MIDPNEPRPIPKEYRADLAERTCHTCGRSYYENPVLPHPCPRCGSLFQRV